MKVSLKSWIAAAALLFCSGAFAAVQGSDYTLLKPAQPAGTKKIEVVEFFFYQCGHCFHLHPYLAQWEKTKAADVEISYVPMAFQAGAEPLAYAYYALEEMGQARRLDDAIYQAVHVKNIELYDLNSIGAFVSKNGVDRTKFADYYHSFSVQSKVKRAKQLGVEMSGAIDHSKLEYFGTPTLLVDGKYVITGLQPEKTIPVLNEVIDMVRKGRVPAEKAGKAKH